MFFYSIDNFESQQDYVNSISIFFYVNVYDVTYHNAIKILFQTYAKTMYSLFSLF